MGNPLARDLDEILLHTEGLWNDLRASRLFITGGTGFFGSWLLESLAWAHDRLDLGNRTVVLTRDPEGFRSRLPHLADHPAIAFQRGDVRSFAFGPEHFSHVIHAATHVNAPSAPASPQAVFSTIVDGTRHVLEFASHCGAETLLFTSSGAVYGTQPPGLTHVSEDYAGAPDPLDPGSAYGEGKRAAELLCAAHGRAQGLQVKIARCFAFVGPYLPLDVHFAVGNFIRDGLRGGPIVVKGDGTPLRSYMYASDLTVWLLTIMLRGVDRCAYNVGSEVAVSIADLAAAVARTFRPEPQVRVSSAAVLGARVAQYVPCTTRGQSTLGLTLTVPLHEALDRTATFYGAHNTSWHVNN